MNKSYKSQQFISSGKKEQQKKTKYNKDKDLT